MSQGMHAPTFADVREIVEECIRGFVGSRPLDQQMSLRAVGIQNLSSFKMALRQALYRRYGPGKEWRLGFDVDDTISAVIEVVVLESGEPIFPIGVEEKKAKRENPRKHRIGRGRGGRFGRPTRRQRDPDEDVATA